MRRRRLTPPRLFISPASFFRSAYFLTTTNGDLRATALSEIPGVAQRELGVPKSKTTFTPAERRSRLRADSAASLKKKEQKKEHEASIDKMTASLDRVGSAVLSSSTGASAASEAANAVAERQREEKNSLILAQYERAKAALRADPTDYVLRRVVDRCAAALAPPPAAPAAPPVTMSAKQRALEEDANRLVDDGSPEAMRTLEGYLFKDANGGSDPKDACGSDSDEPPPLSYPSESEDSDDEDELLGISKPRPNLEGGLSRVARAAAHYEEWSKGKTDTHPDE